MPSMPTGYHPYQVLAHVLHEHGADRLVDLRDAIRDVLSSSRHQAHVLASASEMLDGDLYEVVALHRRHKTRGQLHRSAPPPRRAATAATLASPHQSSPSRRHGGTPAG